jgi:hypothetical protein
MATVRSEVGVGKFSRLFHYLQSSFDSCLCSCISLGVPGHQLLVSSHFDLVYHVASIEPDCSRSCVLFFAATLTNTFLPMSNSDPPQTDAQRSALSQISAKNIERFRQETPQRWENRVPLHQNGSGTRSIAPNNQQLS